jgi:hypothetical protein
MFPARIREYAALTNSPILYWLTYEVNTHRIGEDWAYKWLISFARTPGLIAFHPRALKLIVDNLPSWIGDGTFDDKDDFKLFLDGAFPGQQQELEKLILQAIQNDSVLYKDEITQKWKLSLE